MAREFRGTIGIGPQYLLDVIVLAQGPMPMCNYAADLSVGSAALTLRVDTMEKAGLVRRRYDAEDRRRKIVELTAEGRAWAELLVEREPQVELVS